MVNASELDVDSKLDFHVNVVLIGTVVYFIAFFLIRKQVNAYKIFPFAIVGAMQLSLVISSFLPDTTSVVWYALSFIVCCILIYLPLDIYYKVKSVKE